MKDNGFDRTMLPYDAMGDFSCLFASSEEKEEPPCEDPDSCETDVRHD